MTLDGYGYGMELRGLMLEKFEAHKDILVQRVMLATQVVEEQ
jgi:hypothetical protein